MPKEEWTPSEQRKKQKRRGISRLAKKAAPQSTQKAKEWRDFCAKRESESAQRKKQKNGGIFVPKEGASPQFTERK